MSDQEIALSAGAVEYTHPRTVTETAGKDITADTVLVSLGTYEAPGAWVPPDTISRPSASSVVVQLLVGNSLGLTIGGSYHLWVKITDSPEVVPRRSPGRITIT